MTRSTFFRRGAVAAAMLASPAWGAAGAQQRAPRTPAEAQADAPRILAGLEEVWAQAVVHRDAGVMQRLVSPRWVYTDESGVMEHDAGIRAFTTGTDTVRAASNSEMRSIVYPGAAVVIGVLEMRGRGPTGPFVHRYRFTDTWVLVGTRWTCIASQDYLMPERRGRNIVRSG